MRAHQASTHKTITPVMVPTVAVATKRASSVGATGATNLFQEIMATNMDMVYPRSLAAPGFPPSKKVCTGPTPWVAVVHIMMIPTIIIRAIVVVRNVMITKIHVCSLFLGSKKRPI